MYNIAINFLLVVEVFVAVFIILLVLMQRPKSEGLGAAFGGGMTEGLFGAQTTNVLQKATRWLTGVFFVAALLLSMLYSKSARSDNRSLIQQQLANAPVPKEGNTVNVPVDSNMTQEQLLDLLKKKAAAAGLTTGTSGTSGTQTGSGTNASPSTSGTSPTSGDIQAPPLKLGVPPTTGGSNDAGVKLQTGTAATGADLLHTGTAATPKKNGR